MCITLCDKSIYGLNGLSERANSSWHTSTPRPFTAMKMWPNKWRWAPCLYSSIEHSILHLFVEKTATVVLISWRVCILWLLWHKVHYHQQYLHSIPYLHMVEINTVHVEPLHTIKILILSSHWNLTPETSHAYVTATFAGCTNMTRSAIKIRDSLILHYHYHQQLQAHSAQKIMK